MPDGGHHESALHISVLGEVSAARGGQPLDLGGRRQRSVLALLVLARGDAVGADRLVHDLWGEDAPTTATGALQAFVSHLRRRLEPGRTARSRGTVIVSVGPGYALRVPDDAVDAWRFERDLHRATGQPDPAVAAAVLSAALDLWRGPALVEYADHRWAQAEAARLGELREVAREQLVAARLACGQSAVLVPEIERLVGEQPLREERWRLLVLALYRAHRQADALAALRRARQVLADELGVDPGPALRELEAEVLAQSPALALPRQPVAPPARPDAPASAPLTAEQPVIGASPAGEALVERGAEMADLRACLHDVLAGQGRLALVQGPAGIGKTRLLAEARRIAAGDGIRVLTARGSQLEREYGFGAVRQLFEPVVADPDAAGQLMAGAAASAAPVFDVAGDATRARSEGTLAALHGLYWLTVNLSARAPLLLAVDDVQWCDSGSLRFLAYLVRRVEDLPVLVVATLRTGEPHADEALLAELAHDPATVTVRPGPLSATGVADLVRGRLGADADAAFVTACHRTTSGNPLLLRQLLRALQAEAVRPDSSHADTVTAIGSRAISSLVLMRLGRMPPAATATARAIAVLGDGATLPAVAALCGSTEDDAAAVVATLAKAEVLRDEYPLGFVHPLVADAVYRDLPPGQRQLQHERAARILHDAHAPAERVAAHLMHVPHRADPWVVAVLRSAAATAADRGTPDAASRYLRRALLEPPPADARADVLQELGRLESMADGPAAIADLRAAYDLITDPARRAAVAQMLARTMVFAGTPGSATAFAARAAGELPDDLVDEWQGLKGLERIGGYMHDLDPRLWRVGNPAVVGDGPGARMLAADLAWEKLIDGTDRAGAVELARFALADGVLMDVDIGLLWVVAGVVLHMAGEDTTAFWDGALERAHQRGAMFSALATHLWRGYAEWESGDLRAGLESVTTSHEQSAIWGSSVGLPYTEAFTIGMLIDRGDVAGARTFLEGVRHRARYGDGSRLFGEAHARLLIEEGDHQAALTALDEVRLVQRATRNPVWRPARTLRGLALAGLGRRDEALVLLAEELRAARAWGTPGLVGRTLRVVGEVKGPEGGDDLRAAVALLAGSRARLEYGRALAALAAHHDRAAAVPLLTEAYDIAQRCGADGLRSAVAARLAAAGVPPPPPVAEAALTRTERLVAEHAAAGADERAIAQALLVTPRLVQTTLAALRERGLVQ
ncbi:BTAD domain-containing putative transcriptional regulator [Luedemannella helvata]|uniref:BTAD domain-containing putative transcriptional regulator n=1 Tax=Luedemannella helvata TaxID=349315 RepID=A0ABN2L155_9ACTN